MSNYSRVVGTGSYLPAKVLTNQELAGRVDTNDEWVVTRTGIRQRHIAADVQNPATSARGEPPGHRVSPHCRRGYRRHHRSDDHPGHGLSQHCLHPQAKLGVKGCPAFDVQAYAAALSTVSHPRIRHPVGPVRSALVSEPRYIRASSTGMTVRPAYCSATAQERFVLTADSRRHPVLATCMPMAAMQGCCRFRARCPAAR